MLEIENLTASYGASQVLFGMNLAVREGEAVTLIGRNGMGKTTTLSALFGMIPASGGAVRIRGRDMLGQSSYKIARAGLGLVPEGRQVFPNLSVAEHLVATAIARGPWNRDKVYQLFPRLSERKGSMGNQLSGGEQQMLAIGRALTTNPSLLVLDEATEGLAPLIREEIWNCLIALKGEGLSILIVDKNIDALVRFADRHYIVEKGRVAWQGSNADLLGDPSLKERYIGV
jgi:branched-chain amino acid transport system ATP-binding protein